MCPLCSQRNHETASMCTTGCGLVCHPQCYENHVSRKNYKLCTKH